MDSFDNKKFLVFIPTTKKSKSKTKDINKAMIDMDIYCANYYLIETQVFIISMKDIQSQTGKKTRAKTNPKSVLTQEYYNFLHIILKKDSNTLLLYQKYDYKIHFK